MQVGIRAEARVAFEDMPAKFYIAGHHGFHNRGCEALVRSIVALVRSQFPGCRFVVPSACLQFDRGQWPDADASGVEFVPFYAFPERLRWWNRAYRVAPGVAAGLVPPLPDLPPDAAAHLAGCEAVIVTGGDIISLDYSAASLMRWLAQGHAAIRRGLPVVLWSSSVGPFDRGSRIERFVAAQLARYALLSTREGRSQAYLRSLGLAPLAAVDPAFVLAPQAGPDLLPRDGDRPVLGFNLSPLIAQARRRRGDLDGYESGVLDFLRWAIGDGGWNVALIPHVDPATEGEFEGDWVCMQRLLTRLGDATGRLRLLPPTLNAAALKGQISACDAFIGARTHATIGALSSGVPTLSIAYSVKARGINEDLFGDTRYMLETGKVDAASLRAGLERLVSDREHIVSLLAERLPEWKRRAALPAAALRERLAPARAA